MHNCTPPTEHSSALKIIHISLGFLQKQEEQADNVNTPPTDVPGELIITMVTRAVSAITQRLNSLANFEGTDSKVGF